ncbi:hypothetical protein A8C32_16725 [Flavivirga aquatica]|uniref:Lipoprotein n=2 Tax=Flavivirga aquatica TaxID=1849968 RepID=A0A1E5T8P1_9FLAO|nr:hypothetical protein A8C32_16725 [Flavivirga aquatica]
MLLLIIVKFCKDKEPHTDDGNNPTYAAPKKIIPINKGIDLFKEYHKNRTKLIEPHLRRLYNDSSFIDTKFVWYSLDEIKEYIAYIEKVQKTNPSYNVTGIRLYYGAYSNKHEKFPNQQTFFMVPTMKSEKQDPKHNNMNHIPFYIEYEKGGNPIKGNFVAMDELMLDYNKKERLNPYLKSNQQEGNFSLNISRLFSSTALNNAITSLVYNESEASPPPRNN